MGLKVLEADVPISLGPSISESLLSLTACQRQSHTWQQNQKRTSSRL